MPDIVFTASRTIIPKGTEVMREVVLGLGREYRWDKKFISGAALGGDTYLALTCLFLYPQEDHLVCVPNYVHNHVMVAALRMWIASGRHPNLTVVNTGLDPIKRNDYMLDRGDLLYAFPQTSREQMRGSGTWATIRHARNRGMPISVHPLSGEDPWRENA